MRQATATRSDIPARGIAPVDMVHLSRHTLGNRDLEREVLKLFIRQAEIVMARIDEGDSAAVLLEKVHTVNGSAKGIGAWKVAEAAEAAEAALRAGARADLDTLRAAIEDVAFFIDGLLDA
ncbi:Hpt domain-containing protein [Stappia sp.]|uniref:Hpt domain-containing protein n=1 Tax=Stappia sp. TaxID=1870903 RepID=UPI0032D8C0EA